MTETVTNDPHKNRYELEVGGELAIAAYEKRGDTVVFIHTEVPHALEGKGVGSRLIAGALDDVRREGLHVVAQCSFVAAYLRHHPEQQDLVA